mmetsp:Transcript_16580/g.55775  ORF Transcript_16580/g.55775 Transcript_16580/m.55775 type:complete len:302 (-) Transcript_16580:651-1556(-)
MPPRVAALAVCFLAHTAVGQDPDRRDAAINSPEHQAAMARPVAECEAIAKQDRPGIDFSACRNLRGANLEGLNLAEAKLDYADLTGARLGHANLMRISAQYASFERINGEGVKLDESDLRGTTFREANLQYAQMTGPAIAHADFSESDLRHANIRSLYDADSVNFDRVDLRDTTVTDCHLHYGSFEDAKLQGSKYEDISFYFTFFGGATWTGAVMSDMGFEGGRPSPADLCCPLPSTLPASPLCPAFLPPPTPHRSTRHRVAFDGHGQLFHPPTALSIPRTSNFKPFLTYPHRRQPDEHQL